MPRALNQSAQEAGSVRFSTTGAAFAYVRAQDAPVPAVRRTTVPVQWFPALAAVSREVLSVGWNRAARERLPLPYACAAEADEWQSGLGGVLGVAG